MCCFHQKACFVWSARVLLLEGKEQRSSTLCSGVNWRNPYDRGVRGRLNHTYSPAGAVWAHSLTGFQCE